MIVAFIILIVCYVFLLLYFRWGWVKAISSKGKLPSTPQAPGLISVIIPVRNEEKNIQWLLEDIMAQENSLFEVLVIDDHSEDGTGEIVQRWAELGNGSVRLLRLKVGDFGKKKAITLGVRNARGEVIVTTDADCRVGTKWLKSIMNCFDTSVVKFVFGGVRIRQDGSIGSSLQAVEFASLIGSGVATFGLNHPVMCNGANLAFRKQVFHEVKGYEGNEHIASGDDEFLMRKIQSAYPDGLRFNSFQEGVVETSPQARILDFVNQRIRWAGKWKSHRHKAGQFLALAVFGFHLMFLMLGLGLAFLDFFSALAAGILIKLFAEYMFLYRVMYFLRSKWSWMAFILAGLLYPAYAVVLGILSNLSSYHWKDRKFFQPGMEISS